MSEVFDWKIAIFGLNIVQFVGMMVVFSVIKFNDLRHLEEDVKALDRKQREYEIKQDDRHIANLEAIKDVAVKVGELSGKIK